MDILETNGKCPYCGRKFFSYAPQQRLYGSPVQRCKHCNADYLDRRYVEVAVSGIPAIELSCKKGLMGGGLAIILFLISFGMYMFETRSFGYYHTYEVAIMILSPLLFIFSIVDIIRVLTGSKAHEFEKYKAESEQRLLDRTYAQFLKDLGYNVPDDFLREEQQ